MAAAAPVDDLLASPCAFGDASSGPVSAACDALRGRVGDLLDEPGVVSRLPYGDEGPASRGERIFLLRHFVAALEAGKPLDIDAAEAALRRSIDWREKDGRRIVDAAREAIAAARAGGGWDNEPVLSAAPNAAKISPFVARGKLLTMRTSRNDGLVYAVRAGTIDDTALMKAVTVEELTDFFLYAKAVNERVCAGLAQRSGVLSRVVAVNDLRGVNLFGDASFRNALAASSKKAEAIFPGLGGPTVLLNLPKLLGTLVRLFTPLFPPTVQAKLKFANFDLADPAEILDNPPTSTGRKDLLSFLDGLLKE